jgi:membrane-anchored mycosin MYCP
VINISSVACSTRTVDDAALGAALAYAVDVKDAVVVVAAGNAGGPGHCPRQSTGTDMTWESATVAVSPAWYDDYVLTVGSVGQDGAPSSFSLAGPWVDVAAPAEGLVSLNPSGRGLADVVPVFGGNTPISGTSYAAPVVSGVAALVRSRFPAWTARRVMQRIESTARGRGQWDPVTGNGVVDPVAALRSEAEPVPPPTASVPRQSPEPRSGQARATALIGAGGCAVMLAVAIAFTSLAARLRRPSGDDGVAETGGRERGLGRRGLQQR